MFKLGYCGINDKAKGTGESFKKLFDYHVAKTGCPISSIFRFVLITQKQVLNKCDIVSRLNDFSN